MNNLIEHLEENKIGFKRIDESSLEIDGKVFDLIEPNEDGLLFDDNFSLICDTTANNGYIYKFGGVYYFTLKGDEERVKLNPLRYIGKSKEALKTKSFLGVRGQFELLNGSGLYKDWCKKAKFLGAETLGICEKNTLAGVLKFQLECEANKIKPILGETITILREAGDFRYDLKCYVKNEIGWRNLLLINKELNVTNYKYIVENVFMELTEGLVVVLDPKSLSFSKIFPLDLTLKPFYQLDTVEWDNNDRDKEYLLNLKAYLESELAPVAITDAFYLDKEDSRIKITLNAIGKFTESKSKNQYLKSKEDYFFELDSLFNKSDDNFDAVFNEAIRNEKRIVNSCSFKIETGKRYLPKYKMSEEESNLYEDNEDMFWALIEEGMVKKCPKGKEREYIKRIETEVEVIKLGEVIDYFLIFADIIKWSRENDILTGVARGSAGGCLCAYLLNITEIDPMKYGLLFERFLNVGRVKVSLPDVDCDFLGARRDDVKRYMESKYGAFQVCSVGTYTTLKLKAAIKDIARDQNIDFDEVNKVTFRLKTEKDKFEELFQNASNVSFIKGFVKKYPELVNTLPLLLHQPKTSSIHACATLILPDERDIFTWIPVKKMLLNDGESVLVSEWEGSELDQAGYLKQDILGIKQLDKFKDTLDSVRAKEGVSIDIYNLPMDDEEVYRYFSNGWNGDVFHFGSQGLTGYCRELKPENVEDLIAAISLYRPGAMENNFHNEYVLRKRGEREVEYLWGTESSTNETLGLIIYQEQVMRICGDVGGFTLVESDDIRRAMGKKKQDVLDSYKGQFIGGAISNGCSEEKATDLWEKLEKFAGYSFNKSHAAAYTIMGYISQWLKVHYPIHFWTTAFKFCKEEDIPKYISEINKTGSIKILPPDINKSFTDVYTDFKSKTIYWALSSVRQCGETSTNQIIEEREKNGGYFTLEEFLERHNFTGSKVNKRTVENLILAGAFDSIGEIDHPNDRLMLINEFRKNKKVKIKSADEEKDLFTNELNLNKDWWWTLQQKKLSGVAFFDYEDLCNKNMDAEYIDPDLFFKEDSVKMKGSVGGYVLECNIRETKKKGKMAKLIIEANYQIFSVVVWPEQFQQYEKALDNCEKSILLISGAIAYDSHNNSNQLIANEKTQIVVLN